MKRLALVSFVFGALFAASAVWAAPAFQATSFKVAPGDIAKVEAAVDALFASEVGGQLPGRLWLQARLADGADPATHGFFSMFPSAAAREAFQKKLYATPAWSEFLKSYGAVAKTLTVTRLTHVGHWGDASQDESYWEAYYLDADDPEDVQKAIATFLSSEIGKTHPGQIFLLATQAGGITEVSHVIGVGFASEAEAETWRAASSGTPAWAALIDALEDASDYLGAIHVRDVKEWGASAGSILAK